MFLTPSNGVTSVLEQISETGHVLPESPEGVELVEYMSTMAARLRQGEKFLLPENGLFFSLSEYREEFRFLLRLPYPVTILEFQVRSSDSEKLTKCIAVCMDGGNFPPGYEDVSSLLGGEVGETIGVTGFFWDVLDKVWAPMNHLAVFHRESIRFENGTLNDIVVLPVMPLNFQAYNELGEDGTKLAEVCIHAVMQFCLAVNCKNVRSHELKPPEKVNKKRERNKKPPLFAYKVLTVPGENGDTDLGTSSGRDGPRHHLRRGHLRHLEQGRVVWVRHTVVGNPERGKVGKDYRVVAADAVRAIVETPTGSLPTA